jgi:hypothetical protein
MFACLIYWIKTIVEKGTSIIWTYTNFETRLGASSIDILLYILLMSFIFFCHLKLAMKADISDNDTENT